jgi:Xaa-Pro aminopeptidase
MAEQGVDLVVLGPGAHMAWALDVRPHADERPVLGFVTRDHTAFLMPVLEAESARNQTDLPFHLWSDAEGPERALAELLGATGALGARSIVLDETMRADHAALVQDALPSAARAFTQTTVGRLRMRKDAAEFAGLKTAAAIADRAMQSAWDTMHSGMTEAEVADIVERSFAAEGARAIFRIIGTGGNGAYPHHHTGATRLARGDAVVMDIGCVKDGYPSDITRMAVVGEKPDGYDKIHAIVERAVMAAMAAARPGARAHEVDDAARSIITEAGYGEYFMHRTGHGLGLEVHEPPWITSTSQMVLEEGMVFSIEPGIYLPKRFGLRLEDIVILRADGPEILSNLTRDVRLVGG